MQRILVYGDSLSWGIIPGTRDRLPFEQRWPGVLEARLIEKGRSVRVIEDCLNGRRTVWEDPFKEGRNGLQGIGQRMEVNSPLDLVILMLGINDYQSSHQNNAFYSAQGLATVIRAIKSAPLEPGMTVPPILVVAPPPLDMSAPGISLKFAGAEMRSRGMGDAYQNAAREENCEFFDSGKIIHVSEEDGVHLDADQQIVLGRALAEPVSALLR